MINGNKKHYKERANRKKKETRLKVIQLLTIQLKELKLTLALILLTK